MSKKVLSTLLNEWLEHKKHTVKTSSYYSYLSIVQNNIMPQLGRLTINNFNYSDCLIYYNQYIQHKSNTYKLTIFNILHASCTNYPKTQGMLKQFINQNINKKTIKTTYKLLNKSELELMINLLILNESKYDLGILMAICTGMRIGEICALKFNNIDLNQHLIYVEKTIYRIKNKCQGSTLVTTTPKTNHSQRVIPIHKCLYDKIKSRYSHQNDFVMTQSKHPMDPRILRRHFKLFLEKNEFSNMRFHDLRHSFANLCFDQGVDHKSISELLGHANISTTLNLYVHSNTKKKQKYIDELF
jgi:integrase